ncbi:hypothetical protein EJ04DRAFT_66714 [Polyplosphaeria fusca]|uniref:Uncharacterized protein n=1 Tax=Polyplosphaeria fusca TaxID=682080 RepID=A0A9P4UXX2_9PLEO|nr:hypothetical protein EJ04DRAFT_66714 [Polyplosphaeria fusca]
MDSQPAYAPSPTEFLHIRTTAVFHLPWVSNSVMGRPGFVDLCAATVAKSVICCGLPQVPTDLHTMITSEERRQIQHSGIQYDVLHHHASRVSCPVLGQGTPVCRCVVLESAPCQCSSDCYHNHMTAISVFTCGFRRGSKDLRHRETIVTRRR